MNEIIIRVVNVHCFNDGHKNGMNTRLLWILLHIILHISTFNHSS